MTIQLGDFQSLAAADSHATSTLHMLESVVSALPSLVPRFVDVIAVGSYGRGEAVENISDFEWITIYDDNRVAREEAIVLQADLTKAFAERLD